MFAAELVYADQGFLTVWNYSKIDDEHLNMYHYIFDELNEIKKKFNMWDANARIISYI